MPTIGFSGAVFGLVAFNLGDLLLNRENHAHPAMKAISVLEAIGVFILQFVLLEHVRHWAHIGGFMEGMLLVALCLPTTGFELLDAALPTLVAVT